MSKGQKAAPRANKEKKEMINTLSTYGLGGEFFKGLSLPNLQYLYEHQEGFEASIESNKQNMEFFALITEQTGSYPVSRQRFEAASKSLASGKVDELNGYSRVTLEKLEKIHKALVLKRNGEHEIATQEFGALQELKTLRALLLLDPVKEESKIKELKESLVKIALSAPDAQELDNLIVALGVPRQYGQDRAAMKLKAMQDLKAMRAEERKDATISNEEIDAAIKELSGHIDKLENKDWREVNLEKQIKSSKQDCVKAAVEIMIKQALQPKATENSCADDVDPGIGAEPKKQSPAEDVEDLEEISGAAGGFMHKEVDDSEFLAGLAGCSVESDGE